MEDTSSELNVINDDEILPDTVRAPGDMVREDPGSSYLELEIWGTTEVATDIRRYRDEIALSALSPFKNPAVSALAL
jgi:hypothetical protein